MRRAMWNEHNITHSKIYRFLAFIISLPPRTMLHRNMQKMASASRTTKTTLLNELSRTKEHGTESLEQLNRIALYLTVILMDISVLNTHLAITIDEEIKGVYARHVALLIYEYLDDQPGIFGKEFRDIVSKLPHSSEHLEELRDLGSDLKEIRKHYGKLLYQIRNNVVAHMEQDGERQLEIIESIDLEDMVKLAKTIQKSIGNYTRLLANIAISYSYSPLQIREISKTIEQQDITDK